jgi:hypothetical protein
MIKFPWLYCFICLPFWGSFLLLTLQKYHQKNDTQHLVLRWITGGTFFVNLYRIIYQGIAYDWIGDSLPCSYSSRDFSFHVPLALQENCFALGWSLFFSMIFFLQACLWPPSFHKDHPKVGSYWLNTLGFVLLFFLSRNPLIILFAFSAVLWCLSACMDNILSPLYRSLLIFTMALKLFWGHSSCSKWAELWKTILLGLP